MQVELGAARPASEREGTWGMWKWGRGRDSAPWGLEGEGGDGGVPALVELGVDRRTGE